MRAIKFTDAQKAFIIKQGEDGAAGSCRAHHGSVLTRLLVHHRADNCLRRRLYLQSVTGPKERP